MTVHIDPVRPESPVPALDIAQLTVRFGARIVIDKFSLVLREGETVVITGDSGCGKSTVLRCVLGFVPTFDGQIFVGGEKVSADSIWKLRMRMAYVSQEPQLGIERVRDVLERPFRYRANAALRFSLARVSELFEQLLLPRDLLDKEMTVLSGGEKQRVAIVAALLLGRDILLLDEATSALDKSARAEVVNLLSAEPGLTVLAAAHDAEDLPLSGEVVLLPGGSRG